MRRSLCSYSDRHCPWDTIDSLLVGYPALFEEYSCSLGFLVQRQDVGQVFDDAPIACGIQRGKLAYNGCDRCRRRLPVSEFGEEASRPDCISVVCNYCVVAYPAHQIQHM